MLHIKFGFGWPSGFIKYRAEFHCLICQQLLEADANLVSLNFSQILYILLKNKGSEACLTRALPLNLLKSMTHDNDIKVTQVGCNGTA